MICSLGKSKKQSWIVWSYFGVISPLWVLLVSTLLLGGSEVTLALSLEVSNNDNHRDWMLLPVDRRTAALGCAFSAASLFVPSVLAVSVVSKSDNDEGFVYSNDWTGTRLPTLSLEEAIRDEHLVCGDERNGPSWRMARWPDLILRRPANPVSTTWLGTPQLQRACQLLETTALVNGAVGLAAQQCGVNARIIHLQACRQGSLPVATTFINPRIVDRSPELQLRVWREECLVLPPSFRATVLRDAWVVVEAFVYYDAKENKSSRDGITIMRRRLTGEAARAFQHEYDHDRGILITDHVDLEELETPVMQELERPGHEKRMRIAYQRTIEESMQHQQ